MSSVWDWLLVELQFPKSLDLKGKNGHELNQCSSAGKLFMLQEVMSCRAETTLLEASAPI